MCGTRVLQPNIYTTRIRKRIDEPTTPTPHVAVCKMSQRQKCYVYFFSSIMIFRIRCWHPRSLESLDGFPMERLTVSPWNGCRFPHGTVAGFLRNRADRTVAAESNLRTPPCRPYGRRRGDRADAAVPTLRTRTNREPFNDQTDKRSMTKPTSVPCKPANLSEKS